MNFDILLLLTFLISLQIQESAMVVGRRLYSLTYIHRITEWFGLEETLKIIWFQPLCHEQGHLPLDNPKECISWYL